MWPSGQTYGSECVDNGSATTKSAEIVSIRRDHGDVHGLRWEAIIWHQLPKTEFIQLSSRRRVFFLDLILDGREAETAGRRRS